MSDMRLKKIEKSYLAGMPQLAYIGLSENWLLKECGHRHWMALAGATGKQLPEFHDDKGNKSYAAFTAVRVRSAKLDTIVENQQFSISTQLSRPGKARFCSEHQITSFDNSCVSVDMVSSFIFRRETGNNQSVTRASFASMDAVDETLFLKEADELLKLSKKFRMNDWSEHFGFYRNKKSITQEAKFLPCPNNDFNGANFLYFASFQAFVDRAEWQWFKFTNIPKLTNRDIFFYGNINVGESLTVRLLATKSDHSTISHWCEVIGSEDRKIADIFTSKNIAKLN
jgi:probable biosynthetic protein (TIGR04099 family)